MGWQIPLINLALSIGLLIYSKLRYRERAICPWPSVLGLAPAAKLAAEQAGGEATTVKTGAGA